MAKEKIYTKTALKREFGLTDKCLTYLPPADKIWYGRYKSQRYPAWSESLIQNFLAQDEVQLLLVMATKRRAKRQQAAQKAVATKTNALLVELADIKVQVERLPKKKLKRLTQASLDDWYMYRELNYHSYDEFAYHEATDWDIVNYIRHNLTNYDDELTRLANRVGRQEGFKLISRKIYAEILKVYPEYRTTIEKQLQEHLSQ